MCYMELVNTLLNPKDMVKKVGKWDEIIAVKAVLAGFLIPAIVSFIMLLRANAATALLGAIKILIFGIIGWIVTASILWIVGMGFGSKTEFLHFAIPYAAIAGAIALISWIPIINILAIIYGVYLAYLWVMEYMALPSDKAVFTVLVGIVVSAALHFIYPSISFTI